MISDILDLMRVRSTAYVGKNVTAPWGVLVNEAPKLARFHLVLQGETWVKMPDDTTAHKLKAGDIAIIPNGRAHVYSDRADGTVQMSGDLPNEATGPYFHSLAQDSRSTSLLCGFFDISSGTPPAIMARLPDILVSQISGPDAGEGRGYLLDLLRAEMVAPNEPSQVVLNRLTELVCIYAIGAWLEQTLSTDERLAALVDPRMKPVLDAIHQSPATPWTVEGLAALYGQSRNAFAARFKFATGFAPMSYVRRWRIQQACGMLERGEIAIDEVAFKSGYADTNAFNRAFKREMGVSPGVFKRSRLN